MSAFIKHVAKPTFLNLRYLPKISSSTAAATLRRWPKCSALQLSNQPAAARRSADYKPPLWDFDYIQSLSRDFTEETHLRKAKELIEQVKVLLEDETESIALLELIDDLQMLGLSYHFQDQISEILHCIYSECKIFEERELYSTALAFRLLRQHGFKVSQEVFDCFKNENGDLKSIHLSDTKGLLQLYEASFLSTQGESTLEMAREFSAFNLQKKLDDDDEIDDEYLTLLTRQSLEVPIHWRTRRAYVRWFIDIYEKRPNMNQVVLELAKLDFNIVQATHQQELKLVSRWWKKTGLAEKLPFARDRVVESYILTIGLFEPEYGYSRIIGTKVNALVTIIDDVFDVYGTMEELLLFNNIIQRWDIEAVEQLPEYMQICFHELNNLVNEMGQYGLQIIPYLRKSWADLCTTYMKEAKWYSEKYKPRLEEYIENGCISISVPVMLTHAYFALPNPTQNDVVETFNNHHNIVRYCGTIARLANDLATSPDEMKRGDVSKSVQCYMNERGGDIEEAREYMRSMISDTWKKMNGEVDSPLPESYIKCAFEFGRIAHYVYRDGDDAYGVQNSRVKDRISGLLFDPIL